MQRIAGRFWFVCLFALSSWAIGLSGADTPTLTSQWRERDIVVDGVSDDWRSFTRFSQDVPYSIGVTHDARHLYIALSTSDQGARLQMLSRGLTVWFDNKGGTKRRFGIKYPVGMLPINPDANGRRGGRSGSGNPRGPEQDAGTEDVWERAQSQARLEQLEILGPDDDDRTGLLVNKTPGILVKIGHAEGTLFYEIKVPLTTGAETPYAVNAEPGSTIGVGLQTPKAEQGIGRPSSDRSGAGRGGRGIGGQGRGGFGGGGGRGGFGGGREEAGRGRINQAKPIDEWIAVTLAKR